MNKIRSFFILLGLLSMMACKSKKDAINYSNNEMEKIEVQKNFRSIININYKLDKQGIRDTFNTIIDDFLEEDLVFEDYDLDITVKKSEEALLEFDGKKVLVTLPIEIDIKKETFITTLQGNGKLNLVFVSDIEIDEFWNFNTHSELEHYDWIREPKLNFGVVSLPIEKLANTVIERSKDEIGKNIDYSINEQFNLRNQMLDVMQIIEEPFEIDTIINMFVSMEPDTVSLTEVWNTERWTEGQISIHVNTQMSALRPDVIPGLMLPKFQWSDKIDSISTLRVQLEIDHDQIRDIIKDNFVGQKFEYDDNYIEVHSIELNGYKDKIEVLADVSGTLNGTLVLRGKPYFNNENKYIEVEDIDIKVKTKNILHKAASWLFKRRIKNNLKEMMRFSVEENILLAQQNIDEYLSELNEAGDIDLNIKLKDSYMNSLLITDDHIYLGVDLNLIFELIVHDFLKLQNIGGTLPQLKN